MALVIAQADAKPGKRKNPAQKGAKLVGCADLLCTYRPTRASAAFARVTLARMSSALAVQMNGFGFLL